MMLKSIFIIFSYQLIGEVIQKIFELYIPGPVIGLILLLLTLRFVKNLENDFFQQHIEEDLIRNSENILSHLPLLFVPIGVGVVMHITDLEENLLEYPLKRTIPWKSISDYRFFLIFHQTCKLQ